MYKVMIQVIYRKLIWLVNCAYDFIDRGINCRFEKGIYLLTCCDSVNLEKYKLVNRKVLTAASQKFWGDDISQT